MIYVFNIKNLTFILFIFLGFFIFISNFNKLNFEKNYVVKKTIENENKTTLKNNLLDNQQNKSSSAQKNVEVKEVEKYQEKIIFVKKGQTFSKILDNFNLDNQKKFELINSINEKFNLRNLKVNQKITFFLDFRNNLSKILFDLDFKSNLVVYLNDEIQVKIEELKTYFDIESKEYSISNSLYADGIKNNVPNEILIDLIQLFSFDLDFQRDIKKNTIVSISYQKIYVDEKPVNSFGDIEYAKITINKNVLEYFKFVNEDGFVDYYNKEGKNVKKSLLKTPIDGAKLSSNFGMRTHPILGYTKMHKGIDFAAPTGTPVYAGGNGIIEYAGINGGYGKYIRIRHNNEYKTAYGHLSGFKKGIRKGARVNQGEIIGYVGSTGMSTGPHLHYEIIYQNKQINPLTLKLPSGKILKGDELKKFQKGYKIILANHLNSLFE
tara:strand:- start:10842 stop:12149 length:1308 start_codon:yes stop_codon:yes gene_type:complete